MAEGIVRDAHIMLGAYNITGVHSQYSLNVSNDLLESTAFPLTTRERKVGLRDVEASGSGYLPFGDALGTSGSFNTAADLAEWSDNGACTTALDSGSPQAGANSCEVTSTGAGTKRLSANVTLKANRSYRVVFYYINGTQEGQAVEVFISGGSSSVYSQKYTTAAGWAVGSFDFTASVDGTHTCNLDWTDSGSTTGTIFWDSVTIYEVIDKALYNNMATAGSPVSILPEGSTIGSRAFFFKGAQGEYSPGGSVGELLGFSWAAGANDKLLRGNVLENARVTATSTSTPQQLGAVATNQYLYAALHVLSVGGTVSPTLDVVIQSDNAVGFLSAATPIITFTQATGITSEYATPVDNTTCTTDDYWRVSYTTGGTSEEFVFIVVMAIM